ncbi:MAG: citrate synthase family protein [Pseudomonadota bacterium]
MKKQPDRDHFTVTATEACDRIGISRETLYAYVSRGLVRTIAHPGDGRRSLYDRRDIQALLERKRRGRSRRAAAESTINWGEPVLKSKITRISDGQFYYRGRNAIEWSRDQTLEDTLALLAAVRTRSSLQTMSSVATPDHARPFDRIVAMMAAQAVGNPCGDGRPRAAELLRLTAMSAAGAPVHPQLPVHEILARAWSDRSDVADMLRRALVLCADHELNASAYAARVAASAGASLPACLLAGLATLSGTRHGGMTARCRRWMEAVDRDGLSKLSPSKAPPGFGHPLYPDGDPRTVELLNQCALTPKWNSVVRRVYDATGSHPSLDFALVHIKRRYRLPVGAALGLFAVGRTVGWLAHIFEQRQSGRLIRPRASS